MVAGLLLSWCHSVEHCLERYHPARTIWLPSPEAVCGELCCLIHMLPHSYFFFFYWDKTNGFPYFKTLLRVLVLELLWVLRKLLEGLPGGPGVKTSSSSAGGVGSIPGGELRSHMP